MTVPWLAMAMLWATGGIALAQVPPPPPAGAFGEVTPFRQFVDVRSPKTVAAGTLSCRPPAALSRTTLYVRVEATTTVIDFQFRRGEKGPLQRVGGVDRRALRGANGIAVSVIRMRPMGAFIIKVTVSGKPETSWEIDTKVSSVCQ